MLTLVFTCTKNPAVKISVTFCQILISPVNYDKVYNIKSNLAKSVIKRTKEDGGVYKPSSILEENRVLTRRMGNVSYMPLSQQFINNMTLTSLIYLP